MIANFRPLHLCLIADAQDVEANRKREEPNSVAVVDENEEAKPKTEEPDVIEVVRDDKANTKVKAPNDNAVVEDANWNTQGGGSDDLLQSAMGAFGKWHLLICAAIFLLKFPIAWHQTSAIYLAGKDKIKGMRSEDPISDVLGVIAGNIVFGFTADK